MCSKYILDQIGPAALPHDDPRRIGGRHLRVHGLQAQLQMRHSTVRAKGTQVEFHVESLQVQKYVRISGVRGLCRQWDSARLHKQPFQQRHGRAPGEIMPAADHCPKRRKPDSAVPGHGILRGLRGAIRELEWDLCKVRYLLLEVG